MESAIDVDATFVKDELNKNINKFTSDLSSMDVVNILNDIFFQHSIYFDIDARESNRDDYAKVGVVEGYIDDKLNIHIILNNDIWEELDDSQWFKSFLNVLDSIISHELVHREQLTRSSEIKSVNMASNFTYLSDKREIMANAKSAVNEFLNVGYSKKQILQKLREPQNREINPGIEESEVFWQYTEHFDFNDPVMKLFLTYMYQYLTKQIIEQKLPGEYNKVCKLTSALDIMKLAITIRINFDEARQLIKKACEHFGVVNPPTIKQAMGRQEYQVFGKIFLRQPTTVHATLHELAHYLNLGKATDDEFKRVVNRKYLKQAYGVDDISELSGADQEEALIYATKLRFDAHGKSFVSKFDELLMWWKEYECKYKLSESKIIHGQVLKEAKVKPISPKELWSYIVRNVRELDNKENNEDEAGEKGFSNLDLLLDKNWNSFVFYCKETDIENINSKLKKIGWFISKKQGHLPNFDEDKSYEYEIVIQPFYTEKITSENPKSGILNLPQDIYHFTSINNVNNIKKRGIIPKGSSKVFPYPDRVYFFTTWPGDEIVDMAQEMEHNIKSIDDVAIIEIDTTKIRKKVNFYKDANVMFGSIWTYHHIPPQAIKSIRIRNGDAWREI